MLIVIVVIAILAAISIVAYSGIQKRANNTATISHVSASIKLINAYMTDQNAFPFLGGACLQATCVSYQREATLDTNLKKLGTLPSGAPGSASVEYTYSAARTIDGVVGRLMITYRLSGINLDCGVDNVVKQVAGYITYETYRGTPPRNSSANSSGNTICYVHIPPSW